MADSSRPTGDDPQISIRSRADSTNSITRVTTDTTSKDRGDAHIGEDTTPTEYQDSKGGPSFPSQHLGDEASTVHTGPNVAAIQLVTEVLASEIGVSTLLNRLKHSIASAKEFANFLRKRAQLEDDHCQGLKKLCRTSQESMHRAEHRQGSFAFAYDEMMLIHERMADNGIHFAGSLHQMHDDLLELANAADRNRKGWKTNGLAAEQKVADMEQAMRKQKTKYDSLAEEYDRARTGEAKQGGKVFGLKGPKSAAQHEEDLLRKVQGADQTYRGHVQALQSEKTQLISTTRPEAVKALQDGVKETDSGITMHMQKFANVNEKLLLSNGLIVSPLNGQGGQGGPTSRSMRSAVASINNDRDYSDFVSAQHGKIQHSSSDVVVYERHPVLNPQPQPVPQYSQPSAPYTQPSSFSQQPSQISASQGTQGGPLSSHGPPAQFPSQPAFGMGSRSSTSNFGPPTESPIQGPGHQGQTSGITGGPVAPPPFTQPHNRSFSHGNMQPPLAGPQQAGYAGSRNSTQPGPAYGSNGAAGPPQLGDLPFQSSSQPRGPGGPSGQPMPSQGDRRGSVPLNMQQGQAAHHTPPPHGMPYGAPSPGPSAPVKPIFRVTLSQLYERDGPAVPLVVHQCIQAVDLFGLGLEGIYRQSGSMNHINKLKNMFDTNSDNPALDFRNPENFYHDVNSVTGLLKQFFRDLPDPLLTMEHHEGFIAAAKHDDDIVRRDSMHAIINNLPDPNYATLRAITLHLYRVMDNAHLNRMNSHNLAVIFGPTLMGTDPSTAIADAGWQIKVVDTILQNTYQIFDDD